MKGINIKLIINELELTDYCIRRYLIQSRRETESKQQTKNLVTKLKKRLITGK